MRVLDSTTLLAAWEQGAAQNFAARALILLAAARPQKSAEQWANSGIGERDRELLAIREELFGLNMEAVTACPRCGERLECSFLTRDIMGPVLPAPASDSKLRVEAGGFDITCHVPTTADLSVAHDRDALLDRCVELAKRGPDVVATSALPAEVTAAISDAIEKADPQADVQLALECPACGHQWQSAFDILPFLWGEVEDWARRLLLDVHLLASSYGWSEREIVALTPRRRAMYLELVGAS